MERAVRKTSLRLSPTLVFLLADCLVAGAAFYAAALVRFIFDLEAVAAGLGATLPRAAVFVLAICIGMTSMGMYRARQRPRTWEVVARIMVAAALGALGCILLYYWLPDLGTGRGVLALSVAFAAVGLAVARRMLLRYVDQGSLKRRVLVLGSGRKAVTISRLRRQADRRDFEVIGYVPFSAGDREVARSHGLQPLVERDTLASRYDVDELVVALDDRRGLLPIDLLVEEKFRGVQVTEVVEFLEEATGKINLDLMHPGWLIFSESGHTRRVFQASKRLLDILIAASLLLVTSPVMLLVAVAIKLEDGLRSPILYRQQRVGLHHSVFALMKFRSMVRDAESGSGPTWSAGAGDARVTFVGRLIRRLRVDELPQLINVIRGEMSIVGPRPERPEFVQRLAAEIPFYEYRHCVRPGLTGWAQLNFPYGASVDDARTKLQYDLYYIKRASVLLDLLILLQTAEVVVWGSGISMAGPDHRDKRDAGGAAPPAADGRRAGDGNKPNHYDAA